MSDEPKDQNRGIYIPIGVWKLFEQQVLNAEQILLLGKINTLQDPERGCYASNSWLGEWWGKSKTWVSISISLFKKLGLIKISFLKRGSLVVERQIRVTFQVDDLKGPLKENLKGPPLRKLKVDYKESKMTIRREAAYVFFPSKDSSLQTKKSVASRIVEEYARWNIKNRLHIGKQGSTLTGWSDKTITQWVDRCRGLLKQLDGDKRLIRKVLYWYFEHWREEYSKRCNTFSSFCDKFVDVKMQMEKDSFDQDEEESGPTITARCINSK